LQDISVATAGSGVHVQHTLPYLVTAVETETAAAFEQRLELGWGRVGNERAHTAERIAAGSEPLGSSGHVCAQRPSDPGYRVTVLTENVTQTCVTNAEGGCM